MQMYLQFSHISIVTIALANRACKKILYENPSVLEAGVFTLLNKNINALFGVWPEI